MSDVSFIVCPMCQGNLIPKRNLEKRPKGVVKEEYKDKFLKINEELEKD